MQPGIDLEAAFERMAEDDEIEERRQHGRSDGLEAHLEEAQKLLVAKRDKAVHDAFPVRRRKTSSRSGGLTSISRIATPARRRPTSASSSSR